MATITERINGLAEAARVAGGEVNALGVKLSKVSGRSSRASAGGGGGGRNEGTREDVSELVNRIVGGIRSGMGNPALHLRRLGL